jgi:RHS repeat-associated protein
LYKPWGEPRYASGSLPTDYTFTGQYSHVSDFGLLFFVARWYDPALGRFAQADTIVPGAGSPMALDRYAYTLNNPVRYNDPSGHLSCDAKYVAEGDCGDLTDDEWLVLYGIELQGTWSSERKAAVLSAVLHVGIALQRFTGSSTSYWAFQAVYGGVEITFCKDCVSSGFGWAYADHKIKFDDMYADPVLAARLVVHELGHLFDRQVCAANSSTGTCYDESGKDLIFGTGTARYGLTGQMGTCPTCLGRQGYRDRMGGNWGFAGDWESWQFGANDENNNGTTGEVWADMFLGWTYNTWGGDPRGPTRQTYMNTQMQAYVDLVIP